MLTIDEIGNLNADMLARDFARESHRFHRLFEPGRWMGEATPGATMGTTPSAERIANLLAGRSPDGRVQLARDAGREDRTKGWRDDLPRR